MKSLSPFFLVLLLALVCISQATALADSIAAPVLYSHSPVIFSGTLTAQGASVNGTSIRTARSGTTTTATTTENKVVTKFTNDDVLELILSGSTTGTISTRGYEVEQITTYGVSGSATTQALFAVRRTPAYLSGSLQISGSGSAFNVPALSGTTVTIPSLVREGRTVAVTTGSNNVTTTTHSFASTEVGLATVFGTDVNFAGKETDASASVVVTGTSYPYTEETLDVSFFGTSEDSGIVQGTLKIKKPSYFTVEAQ